MIANLKKEELRWVLALIHRKNDLGFDAKFTFSLNGKDKNESRHRRENLEQLTIGLGNGVPRYHWVKNVFPAGIKEYLEHKCQQEIDDRLRTLEQSEIRS